MNVLWNVLWGCNHQELLVLLKNPSSAHSIGAYCKWRGLSTKDPVKLKHEALITESFVKSFEKIVTVVFVSPTGYVLRTCANGEFGGLRKDLMFSLTAITYVQLSCKCFDRTWQSKKTKPSKSENKLDRLKNQEMQLKNKSPEYELHGGIFSTSVAGNKLSVVCKESKIQTLTPVGKMS